MQRLKVALMAILMAGSAGAIADDEGGQNAAKAIQIGENVNCLDIVRIRNTRVLDDKTILFFMRGNEVYKNALPHACSGLGFEKTFTYSTALNKLCNSDIITVLYTAPLQTGASCGLGMFERIDPARLRKEDQTAPADDDDAE